MTGELLNELTLSSRAPSPAHSYFVAQHWEGAGGLHPDNSMRTKHGWLRRLKMHLSLPTDMAVWLWMDFVSAPTLDPVKRPLALRSTLYYCQLCVRFMPIVRDAEAWRRAYSASDG